MKPFGCYFIMRRDGVELQAIGEGNNIVRVIARAVGIRKTPEGGKTIWEEIPSNEQYRLNLITLENVDDDRKTE